MKRVTGATLLILVLSIQGCSTIKRYSSARYSGEDNSLVKADLFGYRLYPSGSSDREKYLWDLNATAQANLLEILDKRFPENERFLSVLSNNYPEWSSAPFYTENYTEKDLRLVISVSRERNYREIRDPGNGWSPLADRIEYFRMRIRIPDSLNMTFRGWNRYATEYGEIDIAGVTFNRSIDMESVMETGSGERSISGTAGSSFSFKEDQKIKQRYLRLNGRIGDKELEIEEEGTREIDLTGNILADLSISFAAITEQVFIPMEMEDGENGPSAEPMLLRQAVEVPLIRDIPEAVVAEFEYEYLYRHVAGGGRTFQEWDDRVEYFTGTKRQNITLLRRDDIVPPFHCIGTDVPSGEKVMIRSRDNSTWVLKFRNRDDAQLFYEWLHKKALSSSGNDLPLLTGEYLLVFKGKALTAEELLRNKDIIVIPYYSH